MILFSLWEAKVCKQEHNEEVIELIISCLGRVLSNGIEHY